PTSGHRRRGDRGPPSGRPGRPRRHPPGRATPSRCHERLRVASPPPRRAPPWPRRPPPARPRRAAGRSRHGRCPFRRDRRRQAEEEASPLTLQERVWQRRNRLRNRFSSLAASEPVESPAPGVVTRRKSTLADVAERAGVSTSTASRALNGHAGLAPATRAAVQDAAAKLNFQPSALARSLRTQQTFTVGFVVPDVSSPFYAAALKGAQGGLEEAGYRVMLMDASLDVERELAALETLLSHQVDGLLVASTGMPRALFDGAVDAATTPTIFFDGVVEGTGEGAVTLDNEGGITLLVDHLVEHGHERIAVLAGSQRESAGAARLRAFHTAMAAHGISPTDR